LFFDILIFFYCAVATTKNTKDETIEIVTDENSIFSRDRIVEGLVVVSGSNSNSCNDCFDLFGLDISSVSSPQMDAPSKKWEKRQLMSKIFLTSCSLSQFFLSGTIMVEGEHTKDSLLALPVPLTPPKVRSGRARSASAKKPPVTITPKSSSAKQQKQTNESHKDVEVPKSSSSRKRKLSSVSPKEKEKEKGEAEEEIYYPDLTFENFDTPGGVSHFPIEEKHSKTAVASGKKSFSVQKAEKDISADESTTTAERQSLKKLKKSKPQEPKKKETNESKRSGAEGKSVISATLSAVKENLENLGSSVKGVDERSDDIESWESQQVLPSADAGSKSKLQKAKTSEDLKKYDHNLTSIELETSFSALESTVTRYPSSEKKGYTENPDTDLHSRLEQIAMGSGRHVEPAEPFVAPVDSNLLSGPRNDHVPSSSYGGIAFAGVSTDKQVSSCSIRRSYLHFMFRNFMNPSEVSHQLPILFWKNKQKDHDYLNYVKVLQNQWSMNQTIKNIKTNFLLVKMKEENEREKKL
jgi:hypothetical protein